MKLPLQCVSLAGSLSLKSKGFTQKSYSCACIGYRPTKTEDTVSTLNFDEEKMCGHLLTCLAKSFPKEEKCSYNIPTPKLDCIVYVLCQSVMLRVWCVVMSVNHGIILSGVGITSACSSSACS